MPQPRPMSGTVYHPSSNRRAMVGRYLRTPSAILECCGRCWREESPVRKRFLKRQLARFRRNDGKRVVLEQMADAYAEPYDRAWNEEEQERLDTERYDWSVDLADCDCCNPLYNEPDPYIHDDGAGPVDWYHYVEALKPTGDDLYQEEMRYLDWMYDVHQEWLNGYKQGRREGYNEGYDAAMRNQGHELFLVSPLWR